MSNIQRIPVSAIVPPSWNSRLPKTGKAAKEDEAKVESLAASMKTDGQITPVMVEDMGDGRYELIVGSRRLRAAKLNGWTELNADVLKGGSVARRIKINIIENAQRENLTPFEMARAAATLRDQGMKNPEIATDLHVSPSHVSNLNTAYTGLPKPVLEAWERNHECAGIQALCEIARKGKDDDAKVKMWDDIVAAAKKREAAGGGGRSKSGKGGGGGFPVSQKRLGHVVEALSTKGGSPDLTDDLRKWGKALLDYVIQARESPPAAVPKMPTKADKKTAKDKED